ncbi:hypothetical protein X559_0619 [Paenilisteria newyorkensis]|nr:hypothetical protein X559_0619 [Listeria newyorkensis]
MYRRINPILTNKATTVKTVKNEFETIFDRKFGFCPKKKNVFSWHKMLLKYKFS